MRPTAERPTSCKVKDGYCCTILKKSPGIITKSRLKISFLRVRSCCGYTTVSIRKSAEGVCFNSRFIYCVRQPTSARGKIHLHLLDVSVMLHHKIKYQSTFWHTKILLHKTFLAEFCFFFFLRHWSNNADLDLVCMLEVFHNGSVLNHNLLKTSTTHKHFL